MKRFFLFTWSVLFTVVGSQDSADIVQPVPAVVHPDMSGAWLYADKVRCATYLLFTSFIKARTHVTGTLAPFSDPVRTRKFSLLKNTCLMTSDG